MQPTITSSDREPITSTLLEEEPELIDLVIRFIEQLPKRIADIGNAANEKNWPALKSQLHALKGLGANFGYPSISQLTQQMEDMLEHFQYSNITPLLEELDTLCQCITVGGNDLRASEPVR